MELLEGSPNQERLYNVGNTLYFAKVKIGTPQKMFKVVVDTGSEFLWVPDQVCPDVACKNHQRFSVHDSKTGKVLGVVKKNGHQYVSVGSVQYGSGSMQGVWASDLVSVAGTQVSMAMLVATHEQTVPFALSPFDGILGMGRITNKFGGKVSLNFMSAAIEQKKVRKNQISFYFSTTPGVPGAVVVGGTSPRLYTGALRWHPVLKEGPPVWAVQLTSLQVGKGQNLCPRTCVGVIDTGTSLMVTSPEMALKVNQELSVHADCKKLTNAPSVKFIFGGSNHIYKLPAHAVVLEYKRKGTKQCTPAIRSMVPPQVPTTAARHLMGSSPTKLAGAPVGPINKWNKIKSMYGGGKPVLIIGDIFLRHHYSVFDNSDPSNPKVGFATAAKNKGGLNTWLSSLADDL